MKSMKKHLVLPVAFLTLAGCHNGKAPEEQEQTASAPPLQNTGEHEAATKISHPCVVFYSPDSIQLEKLKKENGEEAFYTLADDNQNYMADARAFLEGKGIKIIEPGKGKISFQSKSGQAAMLDLNDPKYSWESWWYDGNKLHKIDMTDIEKAYKQYMK
ncbi:hypothetical protein ACTJJ0_11405 [Chitinophaga sp. 22321]|uniref:Lipoprotein n=1 Tax=Chitinophaga hostae TaxID=2831022 RepID=A0ABS5IW39_9BACT|nr:hypothetical protein [Chitinophaga hostae]MBS0027136.1 hypothetical protein [Chitinophaga hostae]